MKILGLQALRFGVPDVELAKNYFAEWNLVAVACGAGEGRFRTLEGAEIYLAEETSATLPAAVNDNCKLREIVWAVESQDDLDAVEAELAKDRAVTRDSDGMLHSTDPNGLGIAFALTSLAPLSPVQTTVNTPGNPVRKNQRIDFKGRPQVRHLGHVAVFTPNLEAGIDFYTRRLNFRPSDLYPGRGAFLRAAGSHDHHNIFLLNRPKEVGLHHISFEVSDFHEVMLGGQHMQKLGWKSHFGPGRHTLGSNYFWYFQMPFEGTSEYYSDMDFLDDDWETKSWTYSPEIVAAWTAEVKGGAA